MVEVSGIEPESERVPIVGSARRIIIHPLRFFTLYYSILGLDIEWVISLIFY